jgi:hypothetical protein
MLLSLLTNVSQLPDGNVLGHGYCIYTGQTACAYHMHNLQLRADLCMLDAQTQKYPCLGNVSNMGLGTENILQLNTLQKKELKIIEA